LSLDCGAADLFLGSLAPTGVCLCPSLHLFWNGSYSIMPR
jgi:hypothetical protein